MSKKSALYDWMMMICVLVFFSLLFHGGSRLIATQSNDYLPITPAESWFSASLTSSFARQRTELDIKPTVIKRTLAQNVSRNCVCEVQFPVPVADANGNILRGASYFRAVYQSFSLGDGFV